MVMHEDVERILISEQELDAKVSELAEKIQPRLCGQDGFGCNIVKRWGHVCGRLNAEADRTGGD